MNFALWPRNLHKHWKERSFTINNKQPLELWWEYSYNCWKEYMHYWSIFKMCEPPYTSFSNPVIHGCVCGKDMCIMTSTTVLLVMAKSNNMWEDYPKENIYNFCLSWVYQRTQPEEMACLQIYLWNWSQSMGSETLKRFKEKKETDYFSWGGGQDKTNSSFSSFLKISAFF